MGAQAFSERQATDGGEPASSLELLRAVCSLRQELRSLTGELRGVVADNTRLKEQVHRLREEHAGPAGPARRSPGATEVERFREELQDQLDRLRRAVARRTRAHEEAVAPPPARDAAADPRWTRWMMTCLMMSELF